MQRKVTAAAREHAAKLREREALVAARATLPFDPYEAERLHRGYIIARDAARMMWRAVPAAKQVLLWDELSLDGQAIIDPSIEAMLVLWDRGVHVIPDLETGGWFYTAHGETRELTNRQLMLMAGTIEDAPF